MFLFVVRHQRLSVNHAFPACIGSMLLSPPRRGDEEAWTLPMWLNTGAPSGGAHLGIADGALTALVTLWRAVQRRWSGSSRDHEQDLRVVREGLLDMVLDAEDRMQVCFNRPGWLAGWPLRRGVSRRSIESLLSYRRRRSGGCAATAAPSLCRSPVGGAPAISSARPVRTCAHSFLQHCERRADPF
jgi:hypothetical protein